MNRISIKFNLPLLILINFSIKNKLTTNKVKMKNKLITTALSSFIVMGSVSAIAQTTISGNLDITYNAVSADTNTVTGNSYRGFGTESQLNFANKGKLSNGIDYAAGFSWEIDGPDTLTTAAALENRYIDFIMGNTTISISSDHVNTTDQTLVNPVGYGYTGGDGIGNSVSIYPKNLSDNNGLGLGVTHNFGVLRATLNYQPNSETTASNDVANSLASTNVENATNATKSLVLQGDLGVKGLNVLAGKKMQKKEASATSTAPTDLDGTRLSVAYTVGQFTIAGDKIKLGGQLVNQNGTVTAVGNHELEGKAIGLAFAVNKDLSIGVYQAKAESDQKSVAAAEEKTKAITLGYNLGPVTLQAQIKDTENNAGLAANDGKTGGVKLSTKF
ncbi:Porin domain, Gram-negative type [Candidatus Pelagibacterales bacterium]